MTSMLNHELTETQTKQTTSLESRMVRGMLQGLLNEHGTTLRILELPGITIVERPEDGELRVVKNPGNAMFDYDRLIGMDCVYYGYPLVDHTCEMTEEHVKGIEAEIEQAIAEYDHRHDYDDVFGGE